MLLVNPSNAQEAINEASPGETIVFELGGYKGLTLKNKSELALHTKAAVIEYLTLDNCREIAVDGAGIKGNPGHETVGTRYLVYVLNGSQKIRLLNLDVQYGLRRGAYVVGSKEVIIGDSFFDNFGVASIHFSSVFDLEIVNCTFGGHYVRTAHMDFIQGRTNNNGIKIHGCLMITRSRPDTQGIFISDGVSNNVEIWDNLIITGMRQAITVSAGDNVSAHHNTILPLHGATAKASPVSLPPGGRSYDNVYVGKYNPYNYVIDIDADLKRVYEQLFRYPIDPNMLSEDYSFRNFLPKNGSPIQYIGGVNRALELLRTTTEPEPDQYVTLTGQVDALRSDLEALKAYLRKLP